MKIESLRATQPSTPGAPADWRTQLGQIVVEVSTAEGLTGIGVGGGGAAGIHLVQTVLSALLVGRDAEDVEQLHREMCDHTCFYGRGGLVAMAISGVDLALWDLRGKVAEQPIARLLDAEVDLTRAIDTYATVWDDEATRRAIRDGHAAVKLHTERFGDRPDPAEIAGVIRQIRQTLGDEGLVAIDAFARWDVDATLRVAEAVAPYQVAWIEEPLYPDRFEEYAMLVKKSPVPIAGGEHEYLAAGFKRLIDHGLHAVLQPDINWCGGMTTLVDIYQMARTAGVRVCPHRGCEPFALHAIAALDPQPLAESPRAWFTCLDGAPTVQRGKIRLSEAATDVAAGFGVSFNGTDPNRR